MTEPELNELIDRALTLHPQAPDAAARLLHEAAAHAAQAGGDDAAEEPGPELRETLLRAAEHVLLGHLDQGPALAALLDGDLAGVPDARSRCAIALAGGGAAPDWQELSAAERVRAHFNAVLALSRRRDFDGMRRLMAQAQALVPEEDEIAAKSWAGVANNVAADMRCYHQRGDAAHAALMLEAAAQARAAWVAAGGWLQIERADWQLAMCAAVAGEGARALEAARACLAACEQQGGDDYEFCFAHQALALAALAAQEPALARQQREAMAQRVALLAEQVRGYADRCLAELDAALAA